MKNNILVLNNHGLGDVVMGFPFFENIIKIEKLVNILILFKSELEKELFILTNIYRENKTIFKLYSKTEVGKLFWYIFRIKKAYSLGIDEDKSINLFRLLGINNYCLAHPYEYTKSRKKYIFHNDNIIHKSILYNNLLNNNCIIEYKDYFINDVYDNKFGNYIVLSGGSGELEKHKRWSVLGYHKLVHKLMNATNYNIVFVGSQGEQSIVDDILSGLEKYTDRIYQVNGKTNLFTLINILRNSKIVVGNDNGILHIASACNSKVLGLFGSTDYKITGPMGKYINIIDNRIDCAPCYAKNGNIQGCEDNICMKNIDYSKVYSKIMEIIK